MFAFSGNKPRLLMNIETVWEQDQSIYGLIIYFINNNQSKGRIHTYADKKPFSCGTN